MSGAGAAKRKATAMKHAGLNAIDPQCEGCEIIPPNMGRRVAFGCPRHMPRTYLGRHRKFPWEIVQTNAHNVFAKQIAAGNKLSEQIGDMEPQLWQTDYPR